MNRPLRSLRASLLALSVAAATFAPSALAVGTRTFSVESQDDFLAGELRSVAVDSQGRLRAGFNLGAMTVQGATSVHSSLALADGSVLIGTGPTGKIFKISGGQVSELADTKKMAVTALVQGPGNTVFAATLPGGRIFKIDGPGALTELPAIADAEHIYAMAWDAKKNGFYAATGPNGKLFFVQPGGQAQLVFDSDETHLVSVAVADDGTVYAGSSGKGLLFKVTGPGRASVHFNAPGDEVRAIVPIKGGGLYVISNDMGGGPGGGDAEAGPSGPPAPPSGSSGSSRSSSRGRGGGRAGRGALLRIEPDGRAEELLARRDTHFTSLALDDAGKPYVGTGAEGRVYTVDENHTSNMVADTDERQIGAMQLAGKHRYVIGSDPVVFHEIRGTGGNDATWTSKVFDAGLRASFGRLFWRSEGAVEMQMRTGNSNTPDATWSDWSQVLTAPGKPSSPPGRFVQVRARFGKDGNSVLREVQVPFVTDNLRAVVTGIDVKRGGSSSSSRVPASGADVPSRSSTVKLSWRSDNPDSDQLRYRVYFRFETQQTYREITKPDETFTKSDLDWDTASLPEGTYRIKVEASDEVANPPDRITRHWLESGPILVDNTPPVFRKLTAQGRRVQADVVDGLGPIARIDYAINGRTDFRPLLPKDGVFDEPNEEIDVDLSSVLGSGPQLVAIRVFDAAGNVVTRDIEVK